MSEERFEPRNRAERRKMAKLQKKQIKKVEEYIKRHPEAMEVLLDEEAIKEAGINDKDEVILGGEDVVVRDGNEDEDGDRDVNADNDDVNE